MLLECSCIDKLTQNLVSRASYIDEATRKGKGFKWKIWSLQNQFLLWASQTCLYTFSGRECCNCSFFVTGHWKKLKVIRMKNKVHKQKIKMRVDWWYLFDSEIIFFGLGWEEITSCGQKHVDETNNCLCKVSTAQTMRKRNDRLRVILFPV